jgi:cytochrome P450
VYWQLLYILSTPSLVTRLRAEIAPYATVSKPFSIGSFSEAPKLSLDPEDLSKKCPLLKSTYFEALRLTAEPYSVRRCAREVIISDKKSKEETSFLLHKGDFVTLPHHLHMKDPKYFKDPEEFHPDRFLITNEDGSVSVNMRTIRPYGGGSSMCKGRVFAERECLSLVAGVLALWDMEPVDKNGWTIPGFVKTSAVSLPKQDTRVRIKRRVFEWEA